MGTRSKLNDQELNNVVGGAFNFYTKDNENRCYIDGVGTFLCNADASTWIISQFSTGADPATIAQQAVEKGILWK